MTTTSEQQTKAALLRISPQCFQFKASKHSSGQVSRLKVKNLHNSPVGYKFKTNAPLRYSVKPVLGVLQPGQSIEVFVRCDSWVNPQDRFLLQSVTLGVQESETIDATTWKALDKRRIVENFIQCAASASSLTLNDPQDDGSASSASSINSSSAPSSPTTSSVDSHQQQQQQQHKHHQHRTSQHSSSHHRNQTASLVAKQQQQQQQQQQHEEASLLSFGILTKIVLGPVNFCREAKRNTRHLSRFLAVRQYTKVQVMTVSMICLFLGLLLPLEGLVGMMMRNRNHGGPQYQQPYKTANTAAERQADEAHTRELFMGSAKVAAAAVASAAAVVVENEHKESFVVQNEDLLPGQGKERVLVQIMEEAGKKDVFENIIAESTENTDGSMSQEALLQVVEEGWEQEASRPMPIEV